MKTPLQHFSTRRLVTWQGEWEFLRRSLEREPDAPQSWWWKLRLRVLAFVIARYGADPVVRAQDHAPMPLASGVGDFTFGERRTVEPRLRAALGAHLQSIAEANDFPRPAAPPDDDDYWIRQKRIEAQGTRFAAFMAIVSSVAAVGLGIASGGRIMVVTIACLMVCVGLLFALDPLLKLFGRWLKRK